MQFKKAHIRKLKWNGFFQSILWILSGVIFWVMDYDNKLVVAKLAGTLLVVQGVGQLLLFIQEDEHFRFSIVSLIHSVCASFTGIWLMVRSYEAVNYIHLAFAFIMVLHMVENLLLGYRLRLLRSQVGWISYLLAFSSIICAILIVCLREVDIVYMAIGSILVVNGIIGLWVWRHYENKSIAEMGI